MSVHQLIKSPAKGFSAYVVLIQYYNFFDLQSFLIIGAVQNLCRFYVVKRRLRGGEGVKNH